MHNVPAATRYTEAEGRSNERGESIAHCRLSYIAEMTEIGTMKSLERVSLREASQRLFQYVAAVE